MIGDQLRSKMQLYGHPRCVNTAKCLQTAAEKGINIDAKVVDLDNLAADVLEISPLKQFPVLRDCDFVVTGTLGVMSYLDDKGFGMSLVPRNGVFRAQMYDLIMLAFSFQDKLMQDNSGTLIASVMDFLDQRIANSPPKGNFTCGEFCLADIHWTCLLNALERNGHGDAINSKSHIKTWYEKVKQHPSTSKEKIIPFTVIPTADDIQNNQIRDISITV